MIASDVNLLVNMFLLRYVQTVLAIDLSPIPDFCVFL